jgi:hypothetical protein
MSNSKNTEHAVHMVHLSGMEMMGSSTEITVAWFLGRTRRNMPHHLLHLKIILCFFQASLERPGTCYYESPTASRSTGGAQIWRQWDICSDYL